jgi:hypothetical protein
MLTLDHYLIWSLLTLDHYLICSVLTLDHCLICSVLTLDHYLICYVLILDHYLICCVFTLDHYLICSVFTLNHYFFIPPALCLYPDNPHFTLMISASRPSHVRYFTLICRLPIPSNLWLYRINSCSYPSVLCFHRPLCAGLYPGDPFLLLILWFCKLTNPSLPALFCFHPDNPLVITYNLCFISRPSPFHSSNLCLYPTIHSSR